MRILSFAAAALVCLLTLPVLAQTPEESQGPSKLAPAALHTAVDVHAPAVDLPATGSVFAVHKAAGAAAVVQLHATEIKSNSHAAGNFARSMVYAGPHSSVELDGAHAALALPVDTVIYVRLSSEHPDLDRERATLVRLQQRPDTRQVLEFTRNIFGGSLKRKLEDVAVEKLDVEGQPVLRITPVKPLEPGEYGLTFLPKDPALFADTVYDFTVTN